MAERVTLVLAGGSALGAYQGGVVEALDAAGLVPDRIVGSSIGAVNGAILAGNPPERRVEMLRRFWDAAAREEGWGFGAASFGTRRWGDARMHALRSPMLGNPGVFVHRFPGALSMMPGMPGDVSVYDLAPLRGTLDQVIDFDRLNGGGVGLTVVATDLLTGEEVRFEAGRDRIGTTHLVASCGFVPYFPPVELDGRLLCDGGMAANLPLHAALEEPSAEDRLCIAVDLFCRRGEAPRTVGQALDRQLDLLLTSQTAHALEALRWRHEAKREGGAVTLLLLSLEPVPGDAEMRSFDYGRTVLAERWEAGRRDMARALLELGGRRAAGDAFEGPCPTEWCRSCG